MLLLSILDYVTAIAPPIIAPTATVMNRMNRAFQLTSVSTGTKAA